MVIEAIATNEPVSLTKREQRSERRWKPWREDAALLPTEVNEDRRQLVHIDTSMAQLRLQRREASRRPRAFARHRFALYVRLVLLGIVELFSFVFAAPIDWWDRHMTVDANRR